MLRGVDALRSAGTPRGAESMDTEFMSRSTEADTGGMARWLFFTNHLHVLTTLAQRPDLRLREIAREVGITERATHRIVTELVEQGFLTRTRVGSRNHYEVQADAALRHPVHAHHNTGELIRLLTGRGDPPPPEDRAGPSRPEPAAGGSETFRDAFDAAPAAMVIADTEGIFRSVNPAFCAILGRTEDELIGRSFREFTHPDDMPAQQDAVSRLMSEEAREHGREKRYIRPDGTVCWVSFRIAVTRRAQTGERLLVAHVTDISDRKRQEEALTEAEERFRSAFDNAPIGMALVTPDGRFIKVNRSLCELTGYGETALLTRTFQGITHPDDLDADMAHLEQVLAGQRRTYQMEKRYHHADGHVIWATLSVSLVRDPAGNPLYFISQIEDITQRKQRERALGEHAAHLAERMPAAQQARQPLDLAVRDLDPLKEVGEPLGDHAGDPPLRAVAAAPRTLPRA